MKQLKYIILLCSVTVSAAVLSACADNTPRPAAPAPAPEMMKPNS